MAENDTDLILLAALLALTGFLFRTRAVSAAVTPFVPPLPGRKPALEPIGAPIPGRKPTSDLDAIYMRHGTQKGIDWRLIKAIAQVESSEQPNAVNPSDPSYGLMQILCRADGPNESCRNKFPAVPRWAEATQEKLVTDVDFNVHVGSTILDWNLGRYGFPKGIAVYNSWSARVDPDNGPFRNQAYVDNVLAKFNALQSRAP